MASRMKRFTGMLSRSKSSRTPPTTEASVPDYNLDNAPRDSPEANLGHAMRAFCESPSASQGGEEVLHLPVIVDAAESSPVAAAAASQQIRNFLSRDWATKPHVQYNAIMLLRILADNPGPTFTKNFDKTFVSTVKECLRMCKDGSTQQILRETLDSLEANKQLQEGMEGLIQMWRKEKGTGASFGNGSSRQQPPPNDYMYWQPTMGVQNQQQQGDQRHQSRRRQLPPQVELASRIEEAKNTAKILLQLIQSTPAEEVMSNELIREFADRCQTAQKSMQGFINCDSPPPDDDTMLTLIETNEQLSLASSRYQRSVLSARRAMGLTTSPNAENMQNPMEAIASPPVGPQPAQQGIAQADSLFAPGPPQRQSSPRQTWAPPPQPPPSHVPANSESFSAPPGPPPSMLARFNSRDGQPTTQTESQNQAPQLPPIGQPSDPFADPLEHDANPAPLAHQPGYYGQSSATQSNPANRPHSHTFSIDAGPTYDRRPVGDTSYDTSGDAPAPPPKSTQRPWQDSGATPSYIGRQTSAANGTTMHGAGGTNVSEIDGHSEVGRSPTTPTQNTASDSPYDVSPVQSRMR